MQELLPYPWCLFVYVLGFSAAAFIILLAAMDLGKLFSRKPDKKIERRRQRLRHATCTLILGQAH